MLLSRRSLFVSSIIPTIRSKQVLPVTTRSISVNEDQIRIIQHIVVLNKLILDQIENPLMIPQTKDYFNHLITSYDLLVHGIENTDIQEMFQHISPMEEDPCKDVICI